MNMRYTIDGYEVVFHPWHSEMEDEDFVAVYVFKDGKEVLHAGMTHITPSEENARREVEGIMRLNEGTVDK